MNLKPQCYIYLKVSFENYGAFLGCIAASQPKYGIFQKLLFKEQTSSKHIKTARMSNGLRLIKTGQQ